MREKEPVNPYPRIKKRDVTPNMRERVFGPSGHRSNITVID